MSNDSFSERLSPFQRGFTQTSDDCQIHYNLYCSVEAPGVNGEETDETHMECIMMIPGIATDLYGWKFQIEDLLLSNDRSKTLMCCVVDNRGIGKSSAPTETTSYSTERMALDVIETDAIGWDRFHCVGFSMGGMIACKVASMFPERLRSLIVLSATGGGWEIIPRNCCGVMNSILAALCCARRVRSYCDIRFHFTSKTLKEKVDDKGTTRFRQLMSEYMHSSMKKSQSSSGLAGQLRACWHHGLTPSEIRIIRNGGFPVVFIHGRHDMLAHPRFGRSLAKQLGGRYIEVNGAHLIKRECRPEVSRHLLDVVQNGG